jgi:homoserine O-acetyltransferase
MRGLAAGLAAALLAFGTAAAAPVPDAHDYVIKDFKFRSGETLPELKLHYYTLGQPKKDAAGQITNAVLILHGTGGSGANFVEGRGGEMFAAELFGKDQPLDGARFYIVLPDNIGHGKYAKPSDGQRGTFPRYDYEDMIRAQHRLLTEALGVDHLRLVLGTSMGGMHTWLWGQRYPEFMDALVPLASLPTQISGRNRMWRKLIADAIRTDPQWNGGDYTAQPPGLRTAAEMLSLMSSSAALRQKDAPTLKAADELFEREVAARLPTLDANDLLYAIERSWDYDPGPGLGKIRAPLLAINFADDLINPPELGILEKAVENVPKGQALVVPASNETVGHGTHTKAVVWKHHLEKFLDDVGR